MSQGNQTRATGWGLSDALNRSIEFIPPIGALVYPYVLVGFHTSLEHRGGGFGLVPAALLLLAFLMPVAALLAAMHLGGIQAPNLAELRARRVALLAVASPAIFTLTSVALYMVGCPQICNWLLSLMWAGFAVLIALSDRTQPMTLLPARPRIKLRKFHGYTAFGILLVFLGSHLANHLLGLIGPEAHAAMMRSLRHIYRSSVVEPLLMVGFFAQIATGAILGWQYTKCATGRFRTFQLASGIYLIFFIISHSNAVFILARRILNIDSGWGFAIGAPSGLIHDAWNIRLVPLYWLAVFFVLSHLSSGLRAIMLAHGARRELANGVVIWGAVASALIATAILLGMCGLRLQFL